MRMEPSLIIRSAIFGCFIVSVLCYFATAGATPLINLSNAAAKTDLSAPIPDGIPTPSNPNKPRLGTLSKSKDTGSEKRIKNLDQECRVSGLFPASILQWCDLITTVARQNQIPPDLIASVMLQESGGDPSAYSKDGAVGLLQVMPNDGIAANFMCPNGPCFTDRPSIQELGDPVYNVEYGTAMLSGLVERYGNYRDALKAYGPRDMGYYYADLVLAIYQNYGSH